MRVTVCFNMVRVVVPCFTDDKIKDVGYKAVERFRKANQINNNLLVTLHHLKNMNNGYLHDEDLAHDVLDDRDQLIAIFSINQVPSLKDFTPFAKARSNSPPTYTRLKKIDDNRNYFSNENYSNEYSSKTLPLLNNITKIGDEICNYESDDMAGNGNNFSRNYLRKSLGNALSSKQREEKEMQFLNFDDGYHTYQYSADSLPIRFCNSVDKKTSNQNILETSTYCHQAPPLSPTQLNSNFYQSPNAIFDKSFSQEILSPDFKIKNDILNCCLKSNNLTFDKQTSISLNEQPSSDISCEIESNILEHNVNNSVSFNNDAKNSGVIIKSTRKSNLKHDSLDNLVNHEPDRIITSFTSDNVHTITLKNKSSNNKKLTFSDPNLFIEVPNNDYQDCTKSSLYSPNSISLTYHVNKNPSSLLLSKSKIQSINDFDSSLNLNIDSQSEIGFLEPSEIVSQNISVSKEKNVKENSKKSTFLAPENTRMIGQTQLIILTKGLDGLGFSITSRDNLGDSTNNPIYVKNILPKGAAINDGRLKLFDRLLEINGENMLGLNQRDVVSRLRNIEVGQEVKLLISRQVLDQENKDSLYAEKDIDLDSYMKSKELKSAVSIVEENVFGKDSDFLKVNICDLNYLRHVLPVWRDGVFIGLHITDHYLSLNGIEYAKIVSINEENITNIPNSECLHLLRLALMKESDKPGSVYVHLEPLTTTMSPENITEKQSKNETAQDVNHNNKFVKLQSKNEELNLLNDDKNLRNLSDVKSNNMDISNEILTINELLVQIDNKKDKNSKSSSLIYNPVNSTKLMNNEDLNKLFNRDSITIDLNSSRSGNSKNILPSNDDKINSYKIANQIINDIGNREQIKSQKKLNDPDKDKVNRSKINENIQNNDLKAKDIEKKSSTNKQFEKNYLSGSTKIKRYLPVNESLMFQWRRFGSGKFASNKLYRSRSSINFSENNDSYMYDQSDVLISDSEESLEKNMVTSFSREGFGRRSMSEKRKGHIDPHVSHHYCRIKGIQHSNKNETIHNSQSLNDISDDFQKNAERSNDSKKILDSSLRLQPEGCDIDNHMDVTMIQKNLPHHSNPNLLADTNQHLPFYQKQLSTVDPNKVFIGNVIRKDILIDDSYELDLNKCFSNMNGLNLNKKHFNVEDISIRKDEQTKINLKQINYAKSSIYKNGINFSEKTIIDSPQSPATNQKKIKKEKSKSILSIVTKKINKSENKNIDERKEIGKNQINNIKINKEVNEKLNNPIIDLQKSNLQQTLSLVSHSNPPELIRQTSLNEKRAENTKYLYGSAKIYSAVAPIPPARTKHIGVNSNLKKGQFILPNQSKLLESSLNQQKQIEDTLLFPSKSKSLHSKNVSNNFKIIETSHLDISKMQQSTETCLCKDNEKSIADYKNQSSAAALLFKPLENQINICKSKLKLELSNRDNDKSEIYKNTRNNGYYSKKDSEKNILENSNIFEKVSSNNVFKGCQDNILKPNSPQNKWQNAFTSSRLFMKNSHYRQASDSITLPNKQISTKGRSSFDTHVSPNVSSTAFV